MPGSVVPMAMFDPKVLLPAAWTEIPDSVAVNDVYTDAQVTQKI